MVKTHAGPTLVDHVSCDATAIEAPERPTPKSMRQFARSRAYWATPNSKPRP